MTTIKGISLATGAMGAALLVGMTVAPATTAHADGMPGMADAVLLYSDGYMSVIDVYVAPELAGSEAIISADGMPVAGMMLMPGNNPMPLPAASTYVVTALGTGDIAWATTADSWGELPGTD